MAEGKNKILVYADWINIFESLEDDEAGRLIKHFFKYVNDQNPQSDRLTELMFLPIKTTLKRDLENYIRTCGKNAENGKLGGRPKKTQINPNKANGFKNNPTKAKKADSDNDSDNDVNIYRAFAHLSISYDEFNELEEDYTTEQINRILDSIENFKKNTQYKSLYLTAKNWLAKEPKKSEQSKQQKSVEQMQYEHIQKQLNLNNNL